MNPVLKAAAFPALLLLVAGCQVSVDNKTATDVGNATDQVGADLGNVAAGVENTAERAGNVVEQGADAVDNGVSVHVNLHGGADDSAAHKQR